MSDETTTTDAAATTDTDVNAKPPVTLEELQKEVDKWKGLSRKHEDNWKTNSKELDTLRQATMTDADKALEAARAEGRASGLSEAGTRLATAELRAAAATAGVSLPEALTGLLDVSKLLGTDGTPDAAAIAAVVSSFAPNQTQAPVFAQNVGVGPQATGGAEALITRDELLKMAPAAINEARRAGKLNHLLLGG